MQKWHQRIDLTMHADQIIPHITWVGGGVANALDASDGGNFADELGERAFAILRTPSPLGGEGWDEGAIHWRKAGVSPLTPTLSPKGRGSLRRPALPFPMIRIHILPKQRNLNRPLIHMRLHLAQHRIDRARIFRAARIRHYTERAKLIAAFLNRHKR